MLPNDPHTDAERQNAGDRPTFFNNATENDIPILEQLYGTRKKLRIAMLGAGLSGLNFFKRAEERLKNVEIICYEKNADVGGTWYENRYVLKDYWTSPGFDELRAVVGANET